MRSLSKRENIVYSDQTSKIAQTIAMNTEKTHRGICNKNNEQNWKYCIIFHIKSTHEAFVDTRDYFLS